MNSISVFDLLQFPWDPGILGNCDKQLSLTVYWQQQWIYQKQKSIMIHPCLHFVFAVTMSNVGCYQPFLNKDEQISQCKMRIHLLVDLNLQGMCNQILSNRSYYLLQILCLLVFLSFICIFYFAFISGHLMFWHWNFIINQQQGRQKKTKPSEIINTLISSMFNAHMDWIG